MKNVYAYPRDIIEKCLAEKVAPINTSWALISIYGNQRLISTFGLEDTLKDIGCVSFIDLKFDDITDKDPLIFKGQPCILFNADHARKIINFLDSIKEIETLIIHCAQGISRSGAVGVFACRYLGLDENAYRTANPQIIPNLYMLSVLNEVSGINDGYEKVWETENYEKLRSKIYTRMTR